MCVTIHQILTLNILKTFLKKFAAKPYSFLVINATLVNSLHFRDNILEIIQKPIMTIDDKIKTQKLEYDINKEAVKNIRIIIWKN